MLDRGNLESDLKKFVNKKLKIKKVSTDLLSRWREFQGILERSFTDSSKQDEIERKLEKLNKIEKSYIQNQIKLYRTANCRS